MPNDLDEKIRELVASLVAEALSYEPRDELLAHEARVPVSVPSRIAVARRRRLVRVGLAFASVMVVVILIWLFVGRPSNDRHPASPHVAYPSEAVGVTRNRHLVVISTRDGHVVRTLAKDAIYAEPRSGISVSGDGKWVFYTRRSSAACRTTALGSQPATEIARVSVDGGRPERVVPFALSPAASPDGRYLAYTGTPGCSDASQAIVLHPLQADVAATRFHPRSVPSGTSGAISELEWSPDSRYLLFRREIGSTYPYILDTATAAAIEDSYIVRNGDGSAVTGFLGRTGLLVGIFGPAGRTPSDRFEVWSFNATTGQRVRNLFDAGSTQVTSDASGRDVLVSGGALYRWSEGDASAKRIGSNITNAEWVQHLGG